MENEKENTTDPAQSSAFTGKIAAVPQETLVPGEDSREKTTVGSARAEIDTSAPFESVKQAVNLFGGSAVWNSQLRQLFLPNKPHLIEEFEVINLEEQTAQLEKELILKERETLDVLKELEMTKRFVVDLKLRLQKEASEVDRISETHSSSVKVHPILENERENPHVGAINSVPDQSSGTILDELKQAKLNLNRTACDLSKIHAFTESLHSQIDCERTLVEKTHEKLTSGRAIVSFLEKDLKQENLDLQLTEDANDKCNRDPSDISREIELLKSKIEQFRQTAAAAKSEASKLTFEIEQMQAGIKSAEIRLFAAKKMEEAAKAAEVVALAKIEVISNSPNVVLPFAVHAMLTRKVQEADKSSRDKIEASMLDVERANLSKLELLTQVDEAIAEVKTSRKVLEDALSSLDSANSRKLAVEEALMKFKASNPAGTKHALSIGEILCKKLMGLEEYEHDITTCATRNENADISLGQILNRRPVLLSPRIGGGFACKQQAANRKRKNFSFVGLSQLLKQESRKRKNKKRRQVLVHG